MKAWWIGRTMAAAALATLAVGCSSSTSPSDPIVGSWQVTFTNVPAGTQLSPSPWTITISKTDTTYSATYPNLSWSVVMPPTPTNTWTAASDSSAFLIRHDSLYLVARDANGPACYLSVKGPITGNTAQGTVSAGGVMCTPGSWTWSAVKQ